MKELILIRVSKYISSEAWYNISEHSVVTQPLIFPHIYFDLVDRKTRLPEPHTNLYYTLRAHFQIVLLQLSNANEHGPFLVQGV
jgi:hypothetical protein